MGTPTVTPAEAVVRIKAMLPDETKRPSNYLDGFTLLTFGQLAAWKGYEHAREWTEKLILWKIDTDSCRLFSTYKKFLAAEKAAGETPS